MSTTTGDFWLKPATRLGFALVLLFLFLASPVHAQLSRGYISGTAMDAQARGIADAQVTVTNQGTNAQQTMPTTDVGYYRFVALEPGIYSVEFSKPGFETFRIQDITLTGSQEKTINRTLSVSALTTTIDVTDIAGADLDKTNPSIVQTLPGVILDQIPMTTTSLVPGGSRNGARYALFAPAVVRVFGQNEFSANGHRGRDNNFMIDGVDNNDQSVTLPALLIPPEATEALQIQVATFSAEYGRNTGAQVNVITKNGTNAYRGEVWDFYRNSAMEPLSLQNRRAGLKKTPRLIDNQFGGSFSGPIIRDKTFFFGLFQGTLQRQAPRAVGTVTIPTPTGYAALQNTPLRQTPTVQSTASRQAMLQALSFLPTVYPQIKQFNNISTVSVGSVPIEVGTFSALIPDNQDVWYSLLRIDHAVTDRDRVTYRGHIDLRDAPLASGNTAFGERWAVDDKWRAQNHALSYVKTVGSSLVNEARFAYTRLFPDFQERDPVSPTITLNNLFTIGGPSNYPQERLEQTYQFQNVSTFVRNRHSLKFGIDLARTKLVSNNAPNAKGTWAFSSLESFMFNQPTSLTQLVSLPTRYTFHQLRQAYFLQDDIKVTPNFTLNLGLRYETASVPLGYFGATTPEVVNALVPGPGKRDKNNWGPRVGFAYSPSFDGGVLGTVFGEGRSSIRGGFGVSYDPIFYSLLTLSATNFPRSNTQLTPAAALIDVFPTLTPKTAVPTFNPATSAFVNIPSDAQNPTSNYWSLSVQRQFGTNYVMEVGYAGNRSYHLIRQTHANPGILSPEKAAVVVANCTSATLSTCQDPAGFPASPSRLFPTLGSRALLETTGQSEYHGGYVRLERNAGRGLRFGINYTWSATFSDSEEFSNDATSSDGGIATSSPQQPQNFFDRRNEWSRSVFDRPHRLTINHTYRIPWFADTPEILEQIFSGWQFSGLWEVQSGQPFTIRVGADTLGTGNFAGVRPNFNPSGILLADPSTGDLRTFTIPRDGTGIVTAPHVVNPTTGTITFLKNSMPNGGTLGRNTFRGPGYWNTNMSLMKRFTLPGDRRLEIRGDFLNAFNHDNFPNPVADMSSVNFGRNLFAPLTDARQVLLGAKVTF